MTNASIKLYHGLLVRLFAGMPYSPGQLVCANGFSSVSAVAASLTIGIRRKYRDFGVLSLHRIDERRHLGEEGIIVVKLVNLFHIGPRSTDIQGGSVVRVDQFELIPVGDCKISLTGILALLTDGKLGRKLCPLQSNTMFKMANCAIVIFPRCRGKSRNPVVLRNQALFHVQLKIS